MIEAYCYPATGDPERVAPDDLSEHRHGTTGYLWVDIVDPAPAELHTVASEFDLHPLALEGALEPGERPKLDRFPTHDFAVIYDSRGAKVAIFLGPDWVITVRLPDASEHPWDIGPTRTRVDEASPRLLGAFVYRLLDEIVDDYTAHVESFSGRIEDLEDQVLDTDGTHHDDRSLETAVLHLRRELLAFRRIVSPARDVIGELRRGGRSSFDDPEVTIALADVNDHLLRVIEQLDAQRELLGNAFEAHLSIQANQMNLVMKQLTAWGSIVFGATLIAGIYGMNFAHMPELDWRFGYPMAIGLMVTVSLLLHRTFRRRDWL